MFAVPSRPFALLSRLCANQSWARVLESTQWELAIYCIFSGSALFTTFLEKSNRFLACQIQYLD
jgi:hypothetical protein